VEAANKFLRQDWIDQVQQPGTDRNLLSHKGVQSGLLTESLIGSVLLIAADMNFAFSGFPETTLETGNGTAGNFVGIERPTADIGGFKIIALGGTGFTIDDFTFGGGSVSTVPEPDSLALRFVACSLAGCSRRLG
jgi:hypothetical protein